MSDSVDKAPSSETISQHSPQSKNDSVSVDALSKQNAEQSEGVSPQERSEDTAATQERVAALCAVAEQLRDAGEITAAQAEQLQREIPGQYAGSRYVIKHFGVHLSIGAVFAFDVVPLPLGTIGRVGWVVCARITETLRGNLDKARVHSLGVFLVAAIPFLGYVAYLIPLRKNGRSVAFALANEYWLSNRGKSYEQFLAARTRPVARMARWMVPLPWEGIAKR